MILGFMRNIWKMAWYWRTWIALLVLLKTATPMFFVQLIRSKNNFNHIYAICGHTNVYFPSQRFCAFIGAWAYPYALMSSIYGVIGGVSVRHYNPLPITTSM